MEENVALIRVLPNNIPKVWDHVKYAAYKVTGLSDKDMPLYLNRLLHKLLSGTAQCFVRLDDDRKLLGLLVCRIAINEVTGIKDLFIEILYSWQLVDKEEWIRDIEIVKAFADKVGCPSVFAISNNKRVFEIMNSVGFREQFRSFILSSTREV